MSLPSKNGLLHIGQTSAGFKDFLGIRSSSGPENQHTELPETLVVASDSPWLDLPSKKVSGTPCTSLGGLSASAIKDSTKDCSRSFSPPPSCRILSNASASVRNAADISPGMGTAWVLLCARCSPDVSTSSSVEKNVERSGRRGGCLVVEVV